MPPSQTPREASTAGHPYPVPGPRRAFGRKSPCRASRPSRCTRRSMTCRAGDRPCLSMWQLGWHAPDSGVHRDAGPASVQPRERRNATKAYRGLWCRLQLHPPVSGYPRGRASRRTSHPNDDGQRHRASHRRPILPAGTFTSAAELVAHCWRGPKSLQGVAASSRLTRFRD